MGLAIARHAVEHDGGSVVLSNRRGGGLHAELQRMTGSQAYPESRGGHVREARPVQAGSAAYAQLTRGLPHNGVDMMIGGSSRHPVLTQGFDRIRPRPASVAATTAADIDG